MRGVMGLFNKEGCRTMHIQKQRNQASDDLTYRILGCAMEVHRHLGPGLLESVYQTCLSRELSAAGCQAVAGTTIPVTYKGQLLDCGFRADIIVEESVLIEIKAVERLLRVHEAQLLTYLKLTGISLGYLINFNSAPLTRGIRRYRR
jgi:GxxExxY protein